MGEAAIDTNEPTDGSTDGEDMRMNKAKRLAIAGVVAPFLREGADKALKRRVARVDAEGRVVGYTTLAEVQKALLERATIELAVQPNTPPRETICRVCGRLFSLPAWKRRPPKECDACNPRVLREVTKNKKASRRSRKQETCPGWDETAGVCTAHPPSTAFRPAFVKKRQGRPWMCRACAQAKSRDPRTKRAKKAEASS